MKYTFRLTIFVLCAAMCLGGCAMRPKQTQSPAASPAAQTVMPIAQEGPAYDSGAYDAAVEALLQEYIGLREDGIEEFDEGAHPQLPWYSAVVASWKWNSLYYGTWDFDENGVPELIVAAGNDDFCQPVGIYAFDGAKVLYLCPEQPLGERSGVTFTDGLFFVRGSGSAYTGTVYVYRIAPDGFSTDLIEAFDYEYKDAENVEFTAEIGNMTSEELLSHDYLRGFAVPAAYTCFSPSHDGGAGLGMPNPWSEAATPEEAAQGAVLDRFVLPETIGFAAFAPEQRTLSYMDGLAEAVYDNGADRLVIRKGTGSLDVSGDYNTYPENRTLTADGRELRCSGADGQIRLVRWEGEGCSYSASFNADDTSRPGMTEEQVKALTALIA